MEKEKKIHLLVTGASRGIGREICENLSKLKHFVVYGVGRSKIKINNFNYFALDINKKNSLSLLSKKIPKLDVLINNAGIARTKHKSKLKNFSGGSHEISLLFRFNFLGKKLPPREVRILSCPVPNF